MIKKTSRSLNHLQILPLVFHKSLLLQYGYFLLSINKLILIRIQRNQRIQVGNQPKNWWKIQMHLWLLFWDLNKLLTQVNYLLETLQLLKKTIYQILNLIQQLLRINQKLQLVYVHGSLILLNFMMSFYKSDHFVSNLKMLNNNYKLLLLSLIKCNKLFEN